MRQRKQQPPKAAGGRRQNCRFNGKSCFPQWDEECDHCAEFRANLKLVVDNTKANGDDHEKMDNRKASQRA